MIEKVKGMISKCAKEVSKIGITFYVVHICTFDNWINNKAPLLGPFFNSKLISKSRVYSLFTFLYYLLLLLCY